MHGKDMSWALKLSPGLSPRAIYYAESGSDHIQSPFHTPVSMCKYPLGIPGREGRAFRSESLIFRASWAAMPLFWENRALFFRGSRSLICDKSPSWQRKLRDGSGCFCVFWPFFERPWNDLPSFPKSGLLEGLLWQLVKGSVLWQLRVSQSHIPLSAGICVSCSSRTMGIESRTHFAPKLASPLEAPRLSEH